MFTYLFMFYSFLNQELSPPFEYRPRILPDLDWFFIISLIFLFLLAFIKLYFYKSFTLFYRELAKGRSHTHNNDILQNRFPFFSLLVSTCIVFSLAFHVFYIQLYEKENITIFLRIFIFIIVFFLVRFILSKMIGLLFNLKDSISEWEYLTSVLNFLTAILCFPLIFITNYYSFSLLWILVIIIFFAIFLLRFIRGWTIFRKKVKIYEYFLYLCTVEFLPLLLLLKFATNKLLF